MVTSAEAALSEAEKLIDYFPVNERLDAERKRAQEFIKEVISC